VPHFHNKTYKDDGSNKKCIYYFELYNSKYEF